MTLCEVEVVLSRRDVGNGLIRPVGSLLDPGPEVCDHLRRKALFGRHFQVGVRIGNGLEKEAVAGSAGCDGGTCVTSGQEMLDVIELEIALVLFGLCGMTFVARLGEDRANAVLEEIAVVRRDGRSEGDDRETEE